MKKFLFATLCFALVAATVVTLCTKSTVFAASDNYASTDEYKFLQDFLEQNEERYDYWEEAKAAQYLEAAFKDVLGDVGKCEVKEYSLDAQKFHNIVVTLPGAVRDKKIVVGAHFDATGQGANDNGGGVAALYFILQNLVANVDQLPCTVDLVAFGGEERGLWGSYRYVEELSAPQRQEVVLMINIDSILNGDNLYLFCENKKTSLAELILQNDSSGTLVEKPYQKGIYALDVYGYGYYEEIQAADHTPFRTAGIPTAMFFSGTYVNWDYAESTDSSKNTMNTPSDTLDKLDGAQVVARIRTVVSTVSDTILTENFLEKTQNARSELLNNSLLFNVWWPRLLVAGVLIILVVLAMMYLRKLQKKAIMGTAEIKPQTIFEKPDAEDVFSFKNDDIDDIFTPRK